MISAVLQYSTIDYRFLKCNLNQLSKFCDEIIVPICTHFFNGQAEDQEKLHESCNIINSYPNARVIMFDWDDPNKSPRYYHNLSRKLGTDEANHKWILFVDADEILSDEFIDWFKLVKDTDNSYWFTCYWYFREPIYQATRTEGAGMLIKKKYCNWDINSDQERQQLINKTPNFYNGEAGPAVLSLTGRPMMHHFSWVRSKDEMITKVKNWGHASDKNWILLIEEEFSRSFNGTDFVHGYNYNIVENTFNL
jgi:hypothetical protein